MGNFLTNTRCLSFIVCLLPLSANAVTETEFVQIVLNYQPLHEADDLRLIQKQLDLQKGYAAYGDWKLAISGTVGEQTVKTSKDHTNYVSNKKADVRKISTDLQKRFFATGSTLKLSLTKSNPYKDETTTQTQAYVVSDQVLTKSFTDEYENSISISLSIPLMKNRGGIVEQYSYNSTQLNYTNKKLTIQFKKQQLLAKYLKMFLKLGSLAETAQTQKQQLQTIELIITKVNKSRNKKNFNLIKLTQEKLLLQIEATELSITNLARLLTSKLGEPFSNLALKINWDRQFFILPKPSLYLQKHSLLLKKIALQQQINQVKITTLRNNKTPKLDFVISVTHGKNLGNYSTYTYKNQDDYKAELNFHYPMFGDTTNDYDLAKAQIKVRQLQLDYQDRLTSILEKLALIENEIKLTRENKTLIKQEAADLLKISNNNYKQLLRNRIKLAQIIKLQNSLLKSQLKHIKAKLDYRLSCLSYDLLVNRLINSYLSNVSAFNKLEI